MGGGREERQTGRGERNIEAVLKAEEGADVRDDELQVPKVCIVLQASRKGAPGRANSYHQLNDDRC